MAVTPLPEQPLTAESATPGPASAPPQDLRLKVLARLRRLSGLTLPGGLRATLILPYVLLTLLTAMVGIFIVMRLVAGSARERYFNQLREASRAVSDGIVRREQAQLDILRRLAFTDGVSVAIANNDQAALEQLLGPLVINDRIEVLTIAGLDGLEQMSFILNPDGVSYQESRGVDLSGEPLVARVLRGERDAAGDKFAGLRSLRTGAFLFTSAPVVDNTGNIVGALLMGSRLDTLLSELKAQSLADVIALDPSGHITSMTLARPETGAEGLELTSDQVTTLESSLVREQTLYGRQFQLMYTPLLVRQQRVGVLGVALPSDYIISTETTSRDLFAIIFGAGTAATIVFGYLLSQNIARPILRLRSVSQAVASGDLEQTTGVKRPDEIGELASSFDTMTQRLRDRTEEARRLYQETIQRNRELAESNARLQSAQQQLIQSEKLAAVGQLTAGIVHDVKNPLAVIKGLAEILQEEDGLNGFTREQLTLIRDNASRANTIVSDLLKFARQSTPEMAVRDLRETVQSALRLTEYLARRGRIRTMLELPDEPVMAAYDAQQIEQVLINLVQNAIQAMPNGGEVILRLVQVGPEALITVRDTGTGIAPENVRRIFDPFFTTKPEGEGTGLGLSVSYGIISRHRGEITVESVLGRGTTFIIRLPVTQPEAPPPAGD